MSIEKFKSMTYEIPLELLNRLDDFVFLKGPERALPWTDPVWYLMVGDIHNPQFNPNGVLIRHDGAHYIVNLATNIVYDIKMHIQEMNGGLAIQGPPTEPYIASMILRTLGEKL